MGDIFVDTSGRTRAALLTAVAALVGVLVLFALGNDLGSPTRDVHEAAVAATGVLAAAICGLRALRVEAERRAWAIVALAVSSAALGWAAWCGWVSELDAPASPTPSEALVMGFYPVAYLGLATMLRRSFVQAPAGVWLDGLLAGLVASAVGVAIAYDPVAVTSGDLVELGPTLLFPVGDLLLISLALAVLTMAGGRPGVRWMTVGIGMVCWFAADSAYLGEVAGGHTIVGTIPDLLWMAGFAALALAAWLKPAAPEDLRAESTRMLLLPALFSAVALVFLLVDRIVATNDVAVALALCAVATGLARMTLTLREVQLLVDARHESLTDELTGLPSRRQFNRRLEQALVRAADDAHEIGLLLLDLNRFKEVNDTLGHAAGDGLLRLVAGRLREAVGRAGLVARLGGDEFAVLLGPGAGREGAQRTGDRIVQALTQPFEIDGVELEIGASVGVSVFPADAQEGGELLRRADVAMYLAKASGGGVQPYDPARDLHTRDRLALGRQLRSGLEHGELRAYFQPMIDPELGRVLGVEALVRWEHPSAGLLRPEEFLALAERAGLMPQVTRIVLDRALEQLARWRADGMDLTMAVNLSPADLPDATLPQDVADLLARHGVVPEHLCLEVTENGVLADLEAASGTLHRLADLGTRIALDDFGTGWSSLAHLRRLPVHELKIDRSFVTDMARDPEDAAIVRTTLDLARSLRLQAVAEGVADEETWLALARMGFDVIQGDVLSRPLPGPQLTAWLQTRRDGAIVRCRTPEVDRGLEREAIRYRM